MEEAGDYIFEKELARTALGSLWLGRHSRSGGAAGLAIKQFRPQKGLIWRQDEIDRQSRCFLAQAESLKRMGKQSAFWLPLRDTRSDRRGAIAVTDYYPLSAQRLIEMRTPVSAAELHQIVSGIVQGLLDLKKAFNRPHGNLKASNVFLGASRPLASTEVKLADPLAVEYYSVRCTEAGDLRALGGLIAQLVGAAADAEGTDGQGWSRLGSQGKGWKTLAQRCLAATGGDRSHPASLRLEDALSQMPRRPLPLPPVAAVVVSCAIVAVAGMVWYSRPKTMRFNPAEWSRLCTAERGWFGAIETPQWNDLVQSNPELREAMLPIVQARELGEPLDAATIGGVSPQTSLEDLAEQPPVQAMNAPGPMETHAAIETIQAVNKNLARWQLLKQARDLSLQFADQSKPRIYLFQLAADVENRLAEPSELEDSNGFLSAASQMCAARPLITSLASLRLVQDQLRSNPIARADPLLRRFDELVDAQASRAIDMLQMEQDARTDDIAMADLVALGSALLQEVSVSDQGRDWAAMQSEDVIERGSDGEVSLERFANWIDVAAQYRRLKPQEDPWVLSESKRNERVQTIAQGIEQLGGLEKQSQVPSGTAERLRERLERSQNLDSGIPHVEGARGQLQGQSLAALDSLAGLETRLDDYRIYFTGGGLAAFEKVQGVSSSGSEVLDAEWRRRRDLILGQAEVLNSNPHRLSSAIGQLKGLRSRLQDLDKRLPINQQEVAGSQVVGDKLLKAAIERAVSVDVREQMLREALENDQARAGTADDLLAGLTGDAFETKWNSLLANYSQRQADALSLALDFDGVQDTHEHLYGPETTEVLIAAWRQKPALPLDAEILIRDRLLASLAVITDPTRKERMSPELKEACRSRWLNDWESASDLSEPENFETLFNQMGKLDVDADGLLKDPQLSPRLKYDVLLCQLRQRVRSNANSAKEAARTFVDAARLLGREVTEQSAVGPFLASIMGYLSPGTGAMPGSMDLSALGPGMVGWEAAKSDQAGERVTFVPSDPTLADQNPLEFVRVDVPSAGGTGETACYLCRTAVPAGLFVAVVAAHRQAFADMFPDFGLADSRLGPRVWEWPVKEDKPRITRTWLVPNSKRIDDYPPALRPSEAEGRHLSQLHGGDPSPRHPLQYVTPEAAIYFAGLLGCRLPTTGEWLAACRSNGNVAASSPPWNRRDQTWSMQLDYAKQQEQMAFDPVWPDAGIFLPPGGAKTDRQAEATSSYDDSILWFSPVDSDSERLFHHLIGNVSCFAYEDAATCDRYLRERKLAPQVVKEMLGRSTSLFVVGASAISPPELKPESPEPVDIQNVQAAGGYSDVGVRLAFTAPVDTLAACVLERSRYLSLHRM